MRERKAQRGGREYTVRTGRIGTSPKLAAGVRELLADTAFADDRAVLSQLAALEPAAQEEFVLQLACSKATLAASNSGRDTHGAPEGSAPVERAEDAALRQIEQLLAADVEPQAEVRSGRWYRLGRHHLFVGASPVSAPAGPSAPGSFAFCDLAARGDEAAATWTNDWLAGRAEVVGVVLDSTTLFGFARRTRMPYRHLLAGGGERWLALFAGADLELAEPDSRLLRAASPEEQFLAERLRLLERFAPVGSKVYAPLAGEGDLLLLAEISGRTCCAWEPDLEACRRLVARWERLTGKQAIPSPHSG